MSETASNGRETPVPKEPIVGPFFGMSKDLFDRLPAISIDPTQASLSDVFQIAGNLMLVRRELVKRIDLADEANRRRAGWRLFACPDCCDVRWIATRDRFSPSSEVCPFCNEIVLPLDEQRDEELAVDSFCNLVGTPEDRVLRSGR